MSGTRLAAWLRRTRGLRRVSVVLSVALGLSIPGCCPTVETFWSPDGRALTYVGEEHVYLYHVATKQSTPLDLGPGSAGPMAWSPDGKCIVFYSESEDDGAISLCWLNAATKEVKTLAAGLWRRPAGVSEMDAREDPKLGAALSGIFFGTPLSWSPDGSRVACVGAGPRGGAIFVVEYPAGVAERVVETDQIISSVAWSPDGKKIAYVTSEWEIVAGEPYRPDPLWLYCLASASATKVCDLPKGGLAVGTGIQWSGDSGEMGVIVSDLSTGRGVGCLVAAKGAEARQEIRGITEAAAWAPDLKAVVFLEPRESDSAAVIYKCLKPPARKVLGQVGTEPAEFLPGEVMPVTTDSLPSCPQFSPDGRQVAMMAVSADGSPEIVVFTVP